jgi:hypothetical protein
MRHYAGSRPFKWLREKLKIDKPYALPWGQWDVWDKELQRSRPVAYFLTETLPEWLELPGRYIVDPIDTAIYYLRRRFIYRTHLLTTGLPPGKYYDYDTRFLHALFNNLVDFVECEKAWMNVRWDEDNEIKYDVPWWTRSWYFRWKAWRCPRAGLDHLEWEMRLAEPHEHAQANAACELYVLYIWWKEIRSKRDIDEDAWIESGMKDFYSRMDTKYGEHQWGVMSNKNPLTPAERKEYDDLSRRSSSLEEEWHQEDEDMLIRLMKIRRGLWT